MTKQEEWVAWFEEQFGRKPSRIELAEAQKIDYSIETSEVLFKDLEQEVSQHTNLTQASNDGNSSKIKVLELVIIGLLVVIAGGIFLIYRQGHKAVQSAETTSSMTRTETLSTESTISETPSTTASTTESSQATVAETTVATSQSTTRQAVSRKPNYQTAVDTKNLTIAQCENWARAHAALAYPTPVSKEDFVADVLDISESPDGLVYIDVYENHDTANMQALGGDPNTMPSAGHYRINANGYLEKVDILSGGDYRVVASYYFE